MIKVKKIGQPITWLMQREKHLEGGASQEWERTLHQQIPRKLVKRNRYNSPRLFIERAQVPTHNKE